MTLPKRYMITAALPYANGLKHVGHLAGAYLPADIYVRYLRAQKRDVVFACGSDEHGAAITIQAMKEGTTPRAIVNKYHEILKSNFADLNIQFDIYHRTSDPLHHETAQEFFTYLNNNGDLEEKETEQFFDVEANTFLADRYIAGTCPVCGHTNAFGDQCEKCGSTLSPDQLINPRSTLSGNSPIKKLTKHWFLPLDRHEDFLREWILKEHGSNWKPNVLGQCKSWIDAGLQARAVTRDLDWGIKVPDPAPPTPQRGELGKDTADYLSESDEADFTVEEEGEHYGFEQADPMTYGLLKNFVKEQRSNPTEAENILWQLIRGKQLDGYKFRRQHIIGNYIADFVCLNEKLVIEIDGLIHQLPENKQSDQERTQWLEKYGFTVLRFTNNQVQFETEQTLKSIIKKIAENKNSANGHSAISSAGSKLPPSGGGGAGKVLYVWFDAPIGYVSATKQWAIDNKKDWHPYWYDKDTKLVHFIGKDNIVFHCIIFPVMLKLHGNILPTNVPANEFMNLEGDKMSTSRGWSIEMEEYINDWIKQPVGGESMADVLRYYLTTISPETKDSEFTWKGFQDANNSELVSIFGNFVNRAFVLMHKLCKGKVPSLHTSEMEIADDTMLVEFDRQASKVQNLVELYKFRDAQYEVIDLARKGNKYMQDKEPWILDKKLKELTTQKENVTGGDERAAIEKEIERLQKNIDNCLHICLQLTANLAILINPFLPVTARKLCYMMKVVNKMLDWENAGKTKLLSVGYSLREPQFLFRKIEDTEIEIQLQKLKDKSKQVEENKQTENTPVSNGGAIEVTPEKSAEAAVPDKPLVKPGIVFDDFAKIDLKVGTIVTAEKVEKADKLLKLQIDLGFETRTIVSGIAQHFKPEEIVGKQVTVVVNLAPRKMRGIESNGMILMAEDKSGKLHFINPEENINAGSGVS